MAKYEKLFKANKISSCGGGGGGGDGGDGCGGGVISGLREKIRSDANTHRC